MATVKKVAAQIQRFEKGLKRTGRKLVKKKGAELVDYIKATKFRSGGDPGPDYIVSRTGTLEGTLKSVVRLRGGGLVMEISMSGKQARILEEGGKTKAHPIRPKKRGGTLAFEWEKMGGMLVFFKKVNHPGSEFAARDILGRSFEERATQIIRDIEDGMFREWERRIG